MEFKRFIKALDNESIYPITENICNFIISGKRLILGKNDVLIDYDDLNPDIYFIFDGVIQASVINSDGAERVLGFGECGSMIYSTHSFAMKLPSIIRFSACCPTILIRIKKKDFDRFMNEDHEFCKWVSGHFILAIFYKETRNNAQNGDALSKYKWLMTNRPHILEAVSAKRIASYLDITEEHLSRIKRKIAKEL